MKNNKVLLLQIVIAIVIAWVLLTTVFVAGYFVGQQEGLKEGIEFSQSWFQIGVGEARSLAEYYGCSIPDWEWELL